MNFFRIPGIPEFRISGINVYCKKEGGWSGVGCGVVATLHGHTDWLCSWVRHHVVCRRMRAHENILSACSVQCARCILSVYCCKSLRVIVKCDLSSIVSTDRSADQFDLFSS